MGGKKQVGLKVSKIDYDARAGSLLVAKVFTARLEGSTVEDIALYNDLTTDEVLAMVQIAYSKLARQTADEIRAEVEERLNMLLRKATVDLNLATSQLERNGIYKVLLSIEAQRAQLLGLNLRAGSND